MGGGGGGGWGWAAEGVGQRGARVWAANAIWAMEPEMNGN
jgi:hypothetical protein